MHQGTTIVILFRKRLGGVKLFLIKNFTLEALHCIENSTAVRTSQRGVKLRSSTVLMSRMSCVFTVIFFSDFLKKRKPILLRRQHITHYGSSGGFKSVIFGHFVPRVNWTIKHRDMIPRPYQQTPWSIPQTPNQQFMKEFLSFGGLGMSGVCSRGMLGFPSNDANC